jgi:MSHA biogenesis protein MshM
VYYAHFGLKEPPFKITPNTEFFFSGGNRGAVLDALIYAITSGEGIIKVVGEVGSGKTMLCRMLQTLLPEKVESVYLANPSLAPEDILHAIAFELQLKLPKNADRLKVMHALQNYLVARHAAGKQVVIFVEEAQGMPLATLEEMRLLSNLETKHDKLLQIVLFGQPELDVNLNETQIRQLRERITHSFNLGPLKKNEIGDYLIFRLRAAGYFGPHLFSKSAIRMISTAAQGLVRRVNILADKSLLAAFSDNVYQVTPKQVRAAIKDSEFGAEQLRRQGDKGLYWAVITTLVVGLALGVLFNQWHAKTPVKQNLPEAAKPAEKVIEKMAEPVVTAPVADPKPAEPAAPALQPEPQNQINQPAVAPTAAAAPAVVAPIPVAVPVVVAPLIETNDILERRLQATKNWLNQQPASTVSIQLMGNSNDDQLRAGLQTLGTQVELDNVYVFRTKVSNRPFVTVMYGSYPSREEAIQAIQKLPKNLRANRPQLRTIGGILEETKQLQ